MKEVEVTLKVWVPKTETPATNQQIKDWIYFEVGYNAGLSSTNPLMDHELYGNVQDCSINF